MGKRKLMLAIGAALLVGGWGATQFVEIRQQVVNNRKAWDGKGYLAGRVLFAGGVAGMAFGAFLVILNKQ